MKGIVEGFGPSIEWPIIIIVLHYLPTLLSDPGSLPDLRELSVWYGYFAPSASEKCNTFPSVDPRIVSVKRKRTAHTMQLDRSCVLETSQSLSAPA